MFSCPLCDAGSPEECKCNPWDIEIYNLKYKNKILEDANAGWRKYQPLINALAGVENPGEVVRDLVAIAFRVATEVEIKNDYDIHFIDELEKALEPFKENHALK